MEAIAALGLAATICQLVESSSKVFRETSEIVRSGQSVAVADLKLLANDLTKWTSSVENQLKKSVPNDAELSAEEQAIVDLAKRCEEVANILLNCLEKLTSDPNNQHRKWVSFIKALRTRLSSKSITELFNRLSNYRVEILLRYQVLLHAQQRLHGTKLDAIQQRSKQIVEMTSFHSDSLRLNLDQQRAQYDLLRTMQETLEKQHGELTAILTKRDGTSRTIVSPLFSGNVLQALTKQNRDQIVGTYRQVFDDDPDANLVGCGYEVALSTRNLARFTEVVMDGLHFREIDDRHSSIVEAHVNTFKWIFQTTGGPKKSWSNLSQWLRTGTGCYWIKGKPSSGKSTLMKFIRASPELRTHLSQWAGKEDLVVCSFFFSCAGTSLQKSQTGLLRSLLYEFLGKRIGFIPILFPNLWRAWLSGQQRKPIHLTISELRRAFSSLMTTEILDAKVFVLVDGVDECDDDHHELGELVSQATTSEWVKVLLSSRPTSTCLSMFSNFPGLRLEDLTNDDVRQYAESRLGRHSLMRRLEAINTGATAELVKGIVSNACGVFLWVSLVIDILIHGLEERDLLFELRRKLDKLLPNDLRKLYSYMLRSLSEENKIQGTNLLRLVLKSSKTHGDYPMTLLQLSFADEDCNPGHIRDLPSITDAQNERCELMEGRLRSRCCGLVEVLDSPFLHHGQAGSVVRLFHRTVGEFLRDDSNWTYLTTPTDIADLNINDILLRSSLAEMVARIPEPDSRQPSSLTFRALSRMLTYAKMDKDALYLCQTKYFPRIFEVLRNYWKPAGRKSRQCGMVLESLEQFITLASRNPSVLLESLLNAMDDSEEIDDCTARRAPSQDLAEDASCVNLDLRPQKSNLTKIVTVSRPCSITWSIPKLGPRRTHVSANRQQRKRAHRARLRRCEVTGQMHAEVPLIGGARTCIRCRLQKLECKKNPLDPLGCCRSCFELIQPTLTNIPCMRYGIRDASLFREQKGPWPWWTKRWDSMEISDIKEWASTEIRKVKITHGFERASYELELREFIPLPTDMLSQSWTDGDITKFHAIPSYAIADMCKAAGEIGRYVDDNIAHWLVGFVGKSDIIFWDTFYAAFQWSQNASRLIERGLVLNSLRLWVVSRMTSHPEWICGGDRIGSLVTDPSSPYYNTFPIPPVMNAQLEVIMYSTLLRPLRERVLTGLETLLRQNERRNWLTIYFTMFILLHSCSLTTRRDEEFARRIDFSSNFANPESIAEHHIGVLNMLAHFHYDTKGRYPISLIENHITMEEFANEAEVPIALAEFVKQCVERIKHRDVYIRSVRAERGFGNEFYFISQLFDRAWQPTRIAG